MSLPERNEDGFLYFRRADFTCKETGENKIPDWFIDCLDTLRIACNFPLIVTSGYRSPLHSKEIVKDKPGEHTRAAADLWVKDGVHRRAIVENALKLGFTGIGVAKTYVHVDMRDDTPVMWTY